MSTSPEALARGISLAYRANPSLTPGLAYGAGSTDDPIETGADFQRVLWAVNSRDKLGQMDEDHQKKAWHGLTSDEQQLLQQVGYRAPRELHGVGGFLEGVGLGLYHATLGPVFDVLGKGLRATQHVARVGQYLQENQPAGSDPFSRAGSLATHWGEAWRKTMNGDALIHDPQDEATTLDAGARQIALEYATNNLGDRREQQIAQSNLLAKYGATANQLLGDEEFQRYVDALQLRKLSPGRWLVSALGVKRGDVILPEWSIGKLQIFPGVRTVKGQDLAGLLSGEYDALYTLVTDPTLQAGQALKAARAAREATFLMQNYKDFQAVAANPSFRRAVNGIFDIFETNPEQSVGRILDAYPSLNNKDVEALAKLHKAGELTSPEKIIEFYGDKAKRLGVVAGKGQGAFDTSQFFNASTPAETAAATTATETAAKTGLKVNRPFVLPHSSPLAPIRIAAKTTGETLIEGMRSAGLDSGTVVKDALAPVRKAGGFIRKAVTLVPKDRYFNPNSTHALDTFRQIGLYGLSRDEVYAHLQLYAVSDLGGKWAQYRSMLEDTFDALGASPLGTGADLHTYKLDFIGGMEGRILKGSYLEDIGGNSLSQLANDAGESFHAALTPAQINKEAWALPNFAKLADLSSMVHKLRLLAPDAFGKLPEGMIHRFMTEVWKPLVLLRLGFPIRVAGEEAARAMLEEGFVPFTRAAFAFSGAKNEAVATPLRNDSWLMADHKAYVAHLQDLAVEHGGKSGSITAPGRLATWWLPWRDHLAERTISAMAKTKFALAGERYANAADVAIRLHGINIIDPEVAAGGRSAWLDTKPNLLKTIREDGVKTTRKVVVKPGWRGYQATDDLQNIAWQQRLAERHADGTLHAVWLENHKDPAAARQAVYEWLHSDEAKPFLVASARGNHAASLEPAQREVFMHDWADKIERGYRGLYYTPVDEAGASSPILGGKLIRLAKKGEVPTTELLSKIPAGQRPITVSGQRLVELNSRGLIQGIVNAGFERYIDPMINSIARGPLYIHELAKSLDKYEQFRATLLATAKVPPPVPYRLEDILAGADPTPENVGKALSKQTWFHGTHVDDLTAEQLDAYVGDPLALFGPGVYLTNAEEVAGQYAVARTQRRLFEEPKPTDGYTYHAKVKLNKVLDLEDEAHAAYMRGIIEEAAGPAAKYELEHGEGTPELWHKVEDAFTPEQAIEAMRTFFLEAAVDRGLPRSEMDDVFGEIYHTINVHLRRDGFDAYTHTGGLRVGAKEHRVLILLDPQDATRVGRRNVSSLVRSPNGAGELARRRKALEMVDSHVVELANHDAIGNIIPNVHDPLLRSQLQQSHRAMMPFLFAQEQFYKRWGRTLLRDPAIWRKAQLTVHGLRSAGLIHKDANGEDVFVYPAVGFTQGVLTKAVKLVTGKDIQIPVPAGLIGKVKQLNPATERLGLPSFGPLVSVPLSGFGKTARGQNQAYQAATRAIVGDYSLDRPIWEQIAPTVVARLFKAMNADPNRDAEFMSAQMAAITHLEAAGQGLPDDSTPEDAEKFRERVQAWARSFLYLRAIYGFAAPSAITSDIGGSLNELTQEYRDLVAVSDSIEAANVAFIKRHPDYQVENLFAEKLLGRKEKIVGSTNVSALELSRSKLAGKGPTLTPSETVGQYLADHAGFVAKYGTAALWFAPDAPDGFDPRVYSQEIATHLRIRKAPGDFWKEAKIRHAAEMYYPNQRRYEAAAANLSGDALRELQNRWHDWKQAFEATHPFFAESLAQGQARATERQQGIYRLGEALADKSAPKTASRAALQSVVDAYIEYHAAYDSLRGQRDKQSVAARAGLLAALQAFGDSLTDFRAKQAFESLIAPDLRG